MKFQHVYHAVHFEPWLIVPSAHATIADLLESRLAMTAEEWQAARPAKGFFGDALPQMIVAAASLRFRFSALSARDSAVFEKSCGATSTEDVANDITEALGRRDVSGILLNINSPGGTTTGVPELASAIARAAENKPVVAFTDSLMASAAYWLGSQADMIVASKSASVGSVGVYIPFLDSSRRAEMMGLKVDVVKNKEGTLKGMGIPGTSLTEAQREHLQQRADEIFSMFKGDIKSRRPGVKDEALRGQTLLAAGSRETGLIDDIGDIQHARASLAALINMRG